jgi:transglutaminase-like putative cysteine protease
MHMDASPRPAPSSALGRYFEISLYLLLLVSVLALVSTGKLDLFSIFVAPAAVLVKGYRWWRGRGPELSHRAATWLVIGYFLYFPADLWWVSRLLASDAQNPTLYAALLAAVHLLLFALLVRLYSASTTRDYMFLSLLAFCCMLAAAILTVDTTFLAFFLVFLGLCVSTFIGLEMRHSAARSRTPEMASGTLPARRLQSALGATSAAVAVSALVVGAGIFFLIPRFSAGYLSGFNLQPTLITGFSDDVELGEIGQIQRSSAVVMRIKVDGKPGAARGMHWRGVALTTFDGRRWYTEGREPVAISQSDDGWFSVSDESPLRAGKATPLVYTVYLEPMASDALFVAADPVRVRGQFSDEFVPAGRPTRRTYLVVDKTGSVSNPFHNFGNVRYDAESAVPNISAIELRGAGTDYSDDIRNLYLQLPNLDPRIPALAKQITARARNPYDQARAIELYLRGQYGYTLDLSGPPGADPLAYFLFEKRAGHCEYFAAAMTVMLRTLGVPARYINGFLGGEYNDVGDDYIVRASDAHSWVEAYFPGFGWMTFDPTPPSADQALGLLGNLGLYWDWFELQWSEWVINYDFVHQFTLARGIGRTTRNWREDFRLEFDRARYLGIERLRDAQARFAAAPLWMPFALIALAAAFFALRYPPLRERLLLAWRLRATRTALAPDAAALSYRRMLRLLESRGWRKAPMQTPLEFAASLPAGAVTAPVAELTSLYQAARFGGRGVEGPRIAALLADLRAALARR